MKLKDFDFRIWVHGVGYLIGTESISLKKYEDSDMRAIKRDFNEDFRGTYNYVYSQDETEIELFTGLYDKNGKKIYEGDIICCLTSQGNPLYYFITTNENINTFQIFVISDLEKFKICNEIDINSFLFCDLSNLEDMKLNSEVIGNIHNRESISKELK